ncbi:pyruvate dehydrogenase E1 component beta subunit [Colletotrichum asianum]
MARTRLQRVSWIVSEISVSSTRPSLRVVSAVSLLALL